MARRRPVYGVIALAMPLILPLLRSLSLRRLLVLGFGLAILPLALAVMSVVLAVEDLADLSRATVDRVAKEARQSRGLVENLIDVERRGRQYLVLDDEAAREAYEESHRQFLATVDKLQELTVPEDLRPALQTLVEGEQALYQLLLMPPANKPGKRVMPRSETRMKQAAEDFQRLHSIASQVSQGYSRHVDVEAEELSSKLLAVQDRLLWQASTLVPVGLGIVSFFLFLILKPIRQMDLTIRSLGVGELNKPIAIEGPKDLQYLGSRLEWLRTRLVELEQSKQRFLRNVSHEIKTPLANLREGVDLLAEDVVGELNTEQREIILIVKDNAARLEALIAELLQYGRGDARSNERPLVPVDLRALVEALIEDYCLQLRNKDLTVRASLASLVVLGDAEQLRSVVDNLLSNAVKYSPPGGGIDIVLRDLGEAVSLEIEDDGPGIPPEERSKIFEPFYQGRAAREFDVKGSGFGLAIAAECIAAHQGSICALDPHEGRTGARLRVQIPKSRNFS